MEKEKVERTVVHVELLCNNSHHYFGSLAAIYEKFKKEISEYIEQEEDVLSYAVFDQVALNFFKWRKANKEGVDKNLADGADKVYPV